MRMKANKTSQMHSKEIVISATDKIKQKGKERIRKVHLRAFRKGLTKKVTSE